jgi:hypothetical protein
VAKASGIDSKGNWHRRGKRFAPTPASQELIERAIEDSKFQINESITLFLNQNKHMAYLNPVLNLGVIYLSD